MDPVQRLRPYLRDDEQLRWHGVPDPRVRFTRLEIMFIYYAVGAAVLLAFLWYMAARGIPALYAFAGLLTGVWLYAPVSRIFYLRYRMPRSAYGITATRALIVEPTRIRAEPLRTREMLLKDEPVRIDRSPDSRHATVTIGILARRGQTPSQGSGRSLTFENLADPDALLAALAEAGARLTP
jgi:hypothetical protein